MQDSDVHPESIEQRLAAVVRFVAENDGSSVPRVARQLGFSQSQLLRLLALLGDDRSLGGLGLVALQDKGERQVLSITGAGRDWLRRHV